MAKQKVNPIQIDSLYSFRVYINTAYTPSTGSNIVNWDTKSYDPNNNFDLSTDKYTVPVTGYYKIWGRLSLNAGTRCFMDVYKNTSTMVCRGSDNTTTAPASSNLFDRVFLTAGDVIEARFYCATAGAFENDNARSYWGMSLEAS